MSIVCEAFGCLPSAAVRELEQGPAELIWRILDMRTFARAKAEVDRSRNDPKAVIEEGPTRELVLEVEDLAMLQVRAERMEAKRGVK